MRPNLAWPSLRAAPRHFTFSRLRALHTATGTIILVTSTASIMPPLSRSSQVEEVVSINTLPLRLRHILPNPAALVRRVVSTLPQPNTLETRALPPHPSALGRIHRRQEIVAIPNTYGDLNNSPPPGTVVGIVLGSVAAFVFVLWLFYLCFNARPGRGSIVEEEEVVVRERRGSRSSRRAETIEVSRSSSSSSRSRSRPRRSPIRETRTERVTVEERRAPQVARDDDIVEVIEERDRVRRNKSNRNRPQSGFRTVDPDLYGGGNRPVQEVYTKSSRRSGRR